METAKVLSLAAAVVGAPLGFVGLAWLVLAAARRSSVWALAVLLAAPVAGPLFAVRHRGEGLKPLVACLVGTVLFLALPLYLRGQWRAGGSTAGARGEAQPAQEPEAAPAALPVWTTTSEDGLAELSQSGERVDCRVSCSREGREVWSALYCMAESRDLRFVSNDCERVVVLHPRPPALSRWQLVELGHVYHRAEVEYVLKAGGLFREERELVRSGRSLLWLRGVMGVEGSAPHYSVTGRNVEVETVDGQQHSIPLSGQP